MFGLSIETEVNSMIRKDIIFSRAIIKPGHRLLYSDQINELWWRNKLSEQNFGLENIRAFNELEVFEAILNYKTLDKRLLREIDRAIPYYILHVLTYNNRHQILIADKQMKGGRIHVENYIRSCWLNGNELSLDFNEKSIDRLYKSLGIQVKEKSRKSLDISAFEESDSFIRYLQKMTMSRSYKPVLIIAALQSGGQISIKNAANFFVNFYSDRIKNGLPIESGRCVYSDSDSTEKDIENNLIRNPVTALCGSGFFKYDPVAHMFSFAPGIYDGLTVDEIDIIIKICKERIAKYFKGR